MSNIYIYRERAHSAFVVAGVVCLFTLLSLHYIHQVISLSLFLYKGMRKRRGVAYPKVNMYIENRLVKRAKDFSGNGTGHRKRSKLSPEVTGHRPDLFDSLPDDLVLSILCKLTSSAASPTDFVNVLITCKRLNGLGYHSLVLSKASQKMLAVNAHNWSESAHGFLKLCADAGNIEACYTLGMIRFYCLQNRGSGASLMAKAAISSHAPSLYSLAVIQFNGSGGSKIDKDLRAGVALCARAAFLGHIDALRELGHCLQDGYGVKQNIAEGRRFLVQANARELATVLSMTPSALTSGGWLTWNPLPHHRHVAGVVPGTGLRLCSHAGCGRPETRRHEFRRCSVCGTVNYCSRACQALDWKMRHKAVCTRVERRIDEDGENDANGEIGFDNGDDDDQNMMQS
ncbi:F-box protein At1g67340 isoform X2 [Capsicum annuum]|uniref:F-box protein At1g67340 isoform X2 n=1 Tax=Capsicum annuum TaxID=4072 RepID=UPI001FB130CE|nr:F-box protein At1g67340 isoform X2 [Capsicum annuum]